MKSTLSLTDIVEYGTTDGTHLSGEARFSDGKRYRFVVSREWDHANHCYDPAPCVTSMARPSLTYDKREVFNFNHRKPVVYPKRAALIMAAYPEYLARARVEKAAQDEAYEVKQKATNEVIQKERALKDAAPDMLKALQYVKVIIGQHDEWWIGEFANEVDAAIAKATTIPTA